MNNKITNISSASKEKTAESMKEAEDFIEDLPNVEEGSNILTALQKVFKKPSDAEHPRQVSVTQLVWCC